MSIASAISQAQQRVANAYTAISAKGGTLPATQNLANMPTAIGSIPSGGSATIDSLTITPTTSQQTITASGGVDGYSPITVNAVTSSIDNNITAGNIKSGVSILGVTGNYSGTTPSGTINITSNGVYDVTNYASADVSVSGGGVVIPFSDMTVDLDELNLAGYVDSIVFYPNNYDAETEGTCAALLLDADGYIIDAILDSDDNRCPLSITYDNTIYIDGVGAQIEIHAVYNGIDQFSLFYISFE